MIAAHIKTCLTIAAIIVWCWGCFATSGTLFFISLFVALIYCLYFNIYAAFRR